jgi:hypothetical protein
MSILVRQHGNTWFAKLNEQWLFDNVIVSYLEDKGITFVEAVNGSSKVIDMKGSEFFSEDFTVFVKVLLELVGLKEKFGKVKYKVLPNA